MPIVTDKVTKRDKMHEEILTIVSKLMFLNIIEKGSMKRTHADFGYLSYYFP